MSLDKDKLARAMSAFMGSSGHVEDCIAAAIEAYVAELFKPGQLTMLEPIQPARDYRKELWTTVFLTAGRHAANEALAEFDKTFPKEQP